VRCSWFESRLDAFLEGELSPRDARAVATHLEACHACTALYAELRVVDALLHTARAPQLAPNFVYAVMAEVRASAPMRRRFAPAWVVVALYLAASWVALAAAWVIAGRRIGGASAAPSLLANLSATWHALGGAAHAIAPATPAVVLVAIPLLALDAVLAAVVVLFYRNVRPRLAAHLAREIA
jgi:anti-sigma factor RsiW